LFAHSLAALILVQTTLLEECAISARCILQKLVIENDFDVAVAAREILAIAFSTLRSKVIERTRLNANRVIAKAVLMRFI
jgi:hypothetical protein